MTHSKKHTKSTRRHRIWYLTVFCAISLALFGSFTVAMIAKLLKYNLHWVFQIDIIAFFFTFAYILALAVNRYHEPAWQYIFAIISISIIIMSLLTITLFTAYQYAIPLDNADLTKILAASATLLVGFAGILATIVYNHRSAENLALAQVRSFLETISTGEVAEARHRIGTISYNYKQLPPGHQEASKCDKNQLNDDISALFTVLWTFERANAMAESFQGSPAALDLLYGTLDHWISWAAEEKNAKSGFQLSGIQKAYKALSEKSFLLGEEGIDIVDEYQILHKLYRHCKEYRGEEYKALLHCSTSDSLK